MPPTKEGYGMCVWCQPALFLADSGKNTAKTTLLLSPAPPRVAIIVVLADEKELKMTTKKRRLLYVFSFLA